MKQLFFLFIIVFVFGLSCKNDPCLKGKGDAITENRSISPDLRSIKLLDNLKLDIYVDSLNYIELVGGKNLINFIDTKMSGNTLVIENNNRCNFLRGFDREISIALHVTSLNSIEYGGSRDIIMHDTLKVDQFIFTSIEGMGSVKLLIKSSGPILIKTINGGADINIFGSAPHTGCYSSGTSWINAREFRNITTSVLSEGTGDCIFNVEKSLVCYLNGVGNIQYVGEPDITINEKKGSGRVFKAE